MHSGSSDTHLWPDPNIKLVVPPSLSTSASNPRYLRRPDNVLGLHGIPNSRDSSLMKTIFEGGYQEIWWKSPEWSSQSCWQKAPMYICTQSQWRKKQIFNTPIPLEWQHEYGYWVQAKRADKEWLLGAFRNHSVWLEGSTADLLSWWDGALPICWSGGALLKPGLANASDPYSFKDPIFWEHSP